MAAGSGIVEIVEKIIDVNPEAISHVSQDEHNVLPMAVKHRQLKIFNMIMRNTAFKSLTYELCYLCHSFVGHLVDIPPIHH